MTSWQIKLERKTLFYLGRYHACSYMVEAMLMRSYYKADPKPCSLVLYKEAIQTLIIKLQKLSYLNNKTYLESKIRGFFEKGKSRFYIQNSLKQKGFSEVEIHSALDLFSEKNEQSLGDLEREAAQHFVRKKRLGPYRAKEMSPELRQKELGKILRAGFSYELAKKLLNDKI